MSNPESTPQSKKPSPGCVTCLTILILVAVALPFGFSFLRKQARLAHERERAQRRQEAFDGVKNGGSRVRIDDPLLLAMLADDADCIANLEEIFFSMVNIEPDDAKHVARLVNVNKIGFYDSGGADYVLEHARDLPVESLFFEVSSVSDDSLRRLSDFPKLKTVHFEQVIYPEQRAILEALRPDINVEIPFPSENEPGGGIRAKSKNASN